MIEGMMDYGGSSGMYREQPPLRPPPMMPASTVAASISPRFDNIMSRSSSVPWSPIPLAGNPYERSTIDPASTSHIYRKTSDLWTNNNNNSTVRPSDGWMNNSSNIRPTEGWMNNNNNNNPNMKPADTWMNNNIYTKSTEVWTNDNGQSRPLEQWPPNNNARPKPAEPRSPNNNVQSKPTEPWSPNHNVQSKQVEPWSPSNNAQSKPVEPWSPTYGSPKKTDSTIISNDSSTLPMVKSTDKKSGFLTDRCSPNCKLGILGFIIGFLAVGIALAVILVLWLRQ